MVELAVEVDMMRCEKDEVSGSGQGGGAVASWQVIMTSHMNGRYPPVIKHGNGKYTIYRWFSR